MQTSKTYGNAPYRVVLLHGGPGAAGSLQPVAEKISATAGTLEVINNGLSINEQLFEVYEDILHYCDLPVVLAGHSWGAWLVWIFAARYPVLVKKLILISAAPFESMYAGEISATRLSRLEEDEQVQLKVLSQKLKTAKDEEAGELFRKLGKLSARADLFDPVPGNHHQGALRYDIYRNVWPEADQLRKSGELLKMADNISCPVVALHGNYDPHPFKGVHEPLRHKLNGFRMYIIDKCGHYPWFENQAVEDFYEKLLKEIRG